MITARCEILLSPGTVISMSIRGARFTRNSIDKKKPLVNTQYAMLAKKTDAATIGTQYQHPASALNTLKSNPSRNKKNLIHVRTLYLRPRRKAFHIDIFARRIGTPSQPRLARHMNSVRIISL